MAVESSSAGVVSSTALVKISSASTSLVRGPAEAVMGFHPASDGICWPPYGIRELVGLKP